MFGKEPLSGVFTYSVDKKGRLTIPSEFSPEDKEKILLIEEKDFYRIYNLEELRFIFEKLKYFEPQTEEEIELIKKFNMVRKLRTLDSAKRILTDMTDLSCTIIGDNDNAVIIPETTDKNIDYPKETQFKK